MKEKKIGILSVISLVLGILAFIVSFLVVFGVPAIIVIGVAIAAIIMGIVALATKNKIAMPVIGMSLSGIAIIIAIVMVVFGFVKEGYDTYNSYKEKIENLNPPNVNLNTNISIPNSIDYNSVNTYTNSIYSYNNTTNNNNTTNTNRYTNNTNTTNSGTNNSSSGKVVGNVDVGFVTVPNNWHEFVDVDNPGVFQYSYANTYIITMNATQSNGVSADYYATAMKANLISEGAKNVTVEKAFIGGYTAEKIRAYYEDDNLWIDIYLFVKNDGKLEYISIEGPDASSEYFDIPSTFSQMGS